MTSSPKCDRPWTDRMFPFKRQAIRFAAGSLTLLGCAVGPETPAAAMAADKLLNATPLVLKDGRIAEVSVHTIPFPDDAVAPASKTRNALSAFTRNIATDCFLTAQVIGHVDTSEISGRETADIHRLARARADTIQASLIENGLPAESIASVWDWRFMVKQPRVTLWVFRLTAGDDCEGTPLGSENDDQIAAVPSETPVQPTAAEAAAPAVVASLEETSSAQVRQQVIPAAKPRNREVTTPLPTVPSNAGEASVSNVTTEAASAETEGRLGETRVAGLKPSQGVDKKGSIGIVDKGALEIVFAINSSFFPEGAGDQLRAFMKTLDREKSYTLRIKTSVDGKAGVSGASSSDEAARYNAWLAERRFKRVEAWLLKNSDGRKLKLEPSLIENDGSRRVRIEPNPLG